MHSMIIIIQTFTIAMAFEYGPYPDSVSCEQAIPQQEAHVKQIHPTTMALIVDCRDITEHDAVEDRGVIALPDGVS